MGNQRLLKIFGDFMNCLYQKGLTDQSMHEDILREMKNTTVKNTIRRVRLKWLKY